MMIGNSLGLLQKTAAVTDPLFSSVVALLHFEGANNSTTITDQKGHTFTAAGNAKLSTSSPLMGTSSLLLDGNGDYVSAADSSDWDCTGDFIWEVKANAAALATSGSTDPCLLGTYPNGPVGTSIVFALSVAATGDPNSQKPYLYWYDGGNHFIFSSTAIVIGTTFTLAIERVGTTLTMYLNGTAVGSGTISGTVVASGLIIGAVNSTSGFWNGKIDEVRGTRASRYAGNYTPSLTAFPDA